MAKKVNEDLQEDIVKDNVNADESVKEEPGLTETDESIEAEAEEKSDEELLQESVEALKQENSELKDQYLRKHADFEKANRIIKNHLPVYLLLYL